MWISRQWQRPLPPIGYDDYITLEMLPNYKQFPEVSLYADKYAMDKIAQMCVPRAEQAQAV